MWLIKKIAVKSIVIPINCRKSDTRNYLDLLITELVHISFLTGSNRYIFDANQIISDVFIRFWVDEE